MAAMTAVWRTVCFLAFFLSGFGSTAAELPPVFVEAPQTSTVGGKQQRFLNPTFTE